MKFLIILSAILFSANISLGQAQDVKKEESFTVDVKGLNSIQYRIVAKIVDDGCNLFSVMGVDSSVLSPKGAKQAVLKLDLVTSSTMKKCSGIVNPKEVTIVSDWMVLNIASAEAVTFIVDENQIVEVQK